MESVRVVEWLQLHMHWLYNFLTLGLVLSGIAMTGNNIRGLKRGRRRPRNYSDRKYIRYGPGF